MEKIEREIEIKNSSGLHARPAALFVQTAAKFDSRVQVKKDDEIVDGKSIMAILSLGAECGHKVLLLIEGEDANEAIEELEQILIGNE